MVEHTAWNNDVAEDENTISADSNSTEQALFRLQQVSNPGSLIFMISDFRGLTEQAEETVARLSKHNDVVLIFVYDPIESELPPKGLYRVSDQNENAFTLDTNNSDFRQQFHEHFISRKLQLSKLCQRHSMYFLPLCTNDNILSTLQVGLGVKRR